MATTLRSLAPLRSRGVALAAIAGGHVLLVYFLMNGLAQQVLARVSLPPLVADFVPEEHAQRPLPPPLAASAGIARLRPIDQPTSPPPIITEPSDPTGPPPTVGATIEEGTGGTAVAPLPLVLIGKNQLPDTEDYYPPRARRDGQEGISEVRVCVDERGRLQSDPTIQRSSGNALLDSGAIAVARAGRYARATRGGVAVPTCYGFRIAFRMSMK